MIVNGSPLAVTRSLSNADRTLTLTPAVPLAANTVHALSITGVRDTVGNLLVGTVTSTFTTGPGVDFTRPGITTITPADGATGVPVGTTVQVLFTKAMNPVSFNNSNFFIQVANTGATVSATLSFSADLRTAILAPTAPLSAATQFRVNVFSSLTDLAGNFLNVNSQTTFTTQ